MTLAFFKLTGFLSFQKHLCQKSVTRPEPAHLLWAMGCPQRNDPADETQWIRTLKKLTNTYLLLIFTNWTNGYDIYALTIQYLTYVKGQRRRAFTQSLNSFSFANCLGHLHLSSYSMVHHGRDRCDKWLASLLQQKLRHALLLDKPTKIRVQFLDVCPIFDLDMYDVMSTT